MMDLILWRHADAEAGFPDLARQLTEKGRKQAEKMAAYLSTHLPSDTRILSSPAIRTQQTVSALTKNFTIVPAIAPDASVHAVLQAVRWPDGRGTKAKSSRAHLPLLNPDETFSHSTRALKNNAQVAGYLPPAGEGENESLHEFCDTGHYTVLVVGHQPTLGAVAAQLLGSQQTSLRIKKGSLWWFSCSEHSSETTLRLVLTPELL
jgi:phosphohistidine phosphatase SixA